MEQERRAGGAARAMLGAGRTGPMDERKQLGDRALAAFLVSHHDQPGGRFWPLWMGRNKIGHREQWADIQIVHQHITACHACIVCTPKQATVEDCGSLGGTFVNNELVYFLHHGRRVRDGDTICFSTYKATFVALRCVRGHQVPPGGLRCVEGRHDLDEDPVHYRRR
jgi:pSer/pThr/pTyr-binding forkhead associated (FHA) protein